MTQLFPKPDPTIPYVRRLLDVYLLRLENAERSPYTVRNYRAVVSGFLDTPGLPPAPAEWTADHLDIWQANLRRSGAAPSTRAYHERHLWPFLSWLVERGEIVRDPRHGFKRVKVEKKRGRTATTSTLVKFLTVAVAPPVDENGQRKKHARKSPPNAARNAALLHVLWATGIRRTELSRVQFADIDMDARTLRAIHTKTGEERLLPFDKNCKLALAEYFLVRGEEPGALFLANDGKGARPLSSDGMRLILRTLSARAGTDASSHDFRRGFAANVRRKGLDIASTARLLGHSTLTMALLYSEEGEDEAAISAYRKIIG